MSHLQTNAGSLLFWHKNRNRTDRCSSVEEEKRKKKGSKKRGDGVPREQVSHPMMDEKFCIQQGSFELLLLLLYKCINTSGIWSLVFRKELKSNICPYLRLTCLSSFLLSEVIRNCWVNSFFKCWFKFKSKNKHVPTTALLAVKNNSPPLFLTSSRCFLKI